MTFPKHIYCFEVVKDNLKFIINNNIENYSVTFEDETINLSPNSCELFVCTLQKLGCVIHGG